MMRCMATNPDTPETETLPGSLDALETVIYTFDRYVEAGTVGQQASYLVELINAMEDLRTFHPGYEVESGTMPWDREDED